MKQLKKTAYILLAIAIPIAIILIARQCSSPDESRQEIVLEDTPIVIESILPKGELYLCSAIIEDYVQEKRRERHLGIIPESHACVQIMRQKCSYKLDLDKVEYIHDGEGVVLVKLPKIEYVASTQNTPFMSDDEQYWIKEMPSTNKLKEKVEWKIRKRFDTKENREKAQRYAEESIAQILGQLGYRCEFVSKISNKKRRG